MIPIKYNLRSLVVRRVGALMTILGVALTVAVFVSVLALAHGLENTFVQSGHPLGVVVLRPGSQAETNSFFNRGIKGFVETLPGVTDVSAEIIVLINHPRVTGESANLMIRGISEKSVALRPGLKVVEGRTPRSGMREIMSSRSLSTRFKDARLGDTIRIGRSDWKVVGIFDGARTAADSEFWADYNDLAQEFERPGYSSILLRVADTSAIPAVVDRINNDRRIRLEAKPEIEYYRQQTGSAAPIQFLGGLVATIMAIGSCFAVMNTMYAATAYRTREIATLRVLGYRRREIMLSFLLESLILAVLGGAVGCLLALPVNGISTGSMNFATFAEVLFEFQITPRLILNGMVFAAVMGVLGGFLPSRLAARLPIVRALRTEV